MSRDTSSRSLTTMKSSVIVGALLLVSTEVRPFAVQPAPARLALELQDYAALPLTADNTNTNTRAQLARVNFLRDEPGGRRFFVNDLNGPLYLLDKQTRTFTKYLDFNGLAGREGLFPRFTYARNFATGLTNIILDPDYARNGVFYTLHMEDPSTPGSAVPRSGVVQVVVRSYCGPNFRSIATSGDNGVAGRQSGPGDVDAQASPSTGDEPHFLFTHGMSLT